MVVLRFLFLFFIYCLGLFVLLFGGLQTTARFCKPMPRVVSISTVSPQAKIHDISPPNGETSASSQPPARRPDEDSAREDVCKRLINAAADTRWASFSGALKHGLVFLLLSLWNHKNWVPSTKTYTHTYMVHGRVFFEGTLLFLWGVFLGSTPFPSSFGRLPKLVGAKHKIVQN